MLSRRNFLAISAAGATATGLAACSYDQSAYAEAVARLMQPLPKEPEPRDLVRYATLAANGHNTQPWMFRSRVDRIDILPDLKRRTPVVDPDDHHLFASLGCAAENLSLAARARAMSGEVRFETSDEAFAVIDLSPGPIEESDAFRAIPDRQCSRVAYDGKPMPSEVLQRGEAAANRYGVETSIITDRQMMERILGLVVEGNSRQIDDPSFVAELRHWIRFNADAALASRDGLYTAASGNPTFPDWLGPLAFNLFFSKAAENDKYAEHVRSSSGIAVFAARTDDPQGWFNAGRAYQRFALQTTADGFKNAFINQPVEVSGVRRELQTLMGIGNRRPNLVVRFGHGPIMPKSLRRTARDVMV